MIYVFIYIYDRVRARDCMRFWFKMRFLNKIQYRYQIASISPLPGATPHPAAVFLGHVQHAVGRLRAFRDREILVAMGCLWDAYGMPMGCLWDAWYPGGHLEMVGRWLISGLSSPQI